MITPWALSGNSASPGSHLQRGLHYGKDYDCGSPLEPELQDRNRKGAYRQKKFSGTVLFGSQITLNNALDLSLSFSHVV